MRTSSVWQKFFLASQVLLGLFVLPFIGRLDVFPWSTYNLFGGIQRELQMPLVYVHRLDGETFRPPKSIYELVAKGESQFLTFHDHLDKKIRALPPGERLSREEANQVMRHMFSASRDLEYEVTFATLDQLEFLRTLRVKQQSTMGTFSFQNDKSNP